MPDGNSVRMCDQHGIGGIAQSVTGEWLCMLRLAGLAVYAIIQQF